MINIKIDHNFGEVTEEVKGLLTKQIPFSALRALQVTMRQANDDMRKKMPYFILGGPVAFTKRGFLYTKPKSKRAIHAKLYIADKQWEYMKHVVVGGVKRFNKSRHGGAHLNIKETKFNKYGNMPARLKKSAAWKTNLNQGGGEDGLAKDQFIATIKFRSGAKVTGLWKRLKRSRKNPKGKVKLLISFNETTYDYNQTVPFNSSGQRFLVRRFKRAFPKAFKKVINSELKRIKAK